MNLTDEQLKSVCVEVTTYPCPACQGHGATRSPGEEAPERTPCQACNETGRERHQVPLDDLPELWARGRDLVHVRTGPAKGAPTEPAAPPALPPPDPGAPGPQGCPVDQVRASDGG